MKIELNKDVDHVLVLCKNEANLLSLYKIKIDENTGEFQLMEYDRYNNNTFEKFAIQNLATVSILGDQYFKCIGRSYGLENIVAELMAVECLPSDFETGNVTNINRLSHASSILYKSTLPKDAVIIVVDKLD